MATSSNLGNMFGAAGASLFLSFLRSQILPTTCDSEVLARPAGRDITFVLRRVPFLRSRPSRAMIALPIACTMIGAILPFTPLAQVLGFAPLPLEFFPSCSP